VISFLLIDREVFVFQIDGADREDDPQRNCRVPVMAEAISDNNTALKTVKPQNKKGLTETMIFPSAVCFTLNSISFCAVASATVTYNSPMQATSCAARFLEFMSIVSSNLYTVPCLAFSQIPNFLASDFESPTIAATELEFFTA
jgi:hypothetical protein